jgi:antirestriction protein ArdC
MKYRHRPTRHKQRLDRDFGRKRFGDEGYAMEELVAELGAAFVSTDLDCHWLRC